MNGFREFDTPMPTKRAIFSALTHDELRDNVDRYGLDVHDRRLRSQLVDALGTLAGPPGAAACGSSASWKGSARRRRHEEPLPGRAGAGVRRLTAYCRRAGSQADRPSSSCSEPARHDARTEDAPLSIIGKLVGQEHVAATSAAHSSRNHGDSRGTIQDFVYGASVLQRRVDPAGNDPVRPLVPELEPALGWQDSQKATRHPLLFIQDMIAAEPLLNSADFAHVPKNEACDP